MRKPKEAKIQRYAGELRHNLTDAEIKLWQALRMHQMDGIYFRRQHAIGYYIVDFCSPAWKLVIELDGGQHLVQEKCDQKRTEYLESQGYHALPFWDHEVLTDLDTVMQKICDSIKQS